MKEISVIIPDQIIKSYLNNPFLDNVMLTKYGYYPEAKGHYIKRNGIEEYILIYCVDGQGMVEVDNNIFIIKKGQAFIINKYVPHSYSADDKKPWSIYWCHFTGNGVPLLLSYIYKDRIFSPLNLGYQGRIQEYFEGIFRSFSIEYSQLELMRGAELLVQILHEFIIILDNSSKNKKKFEDIQLVIEFMQNHIEQKCTLDFLSSHIGLSKYHFVRKFKEYANYSPLEYFNRLKIQYASELLTNTNLTVTEISNKLQFSSPYHFSKQFKEVSKYSPTEFRKVMTVKV